MLNRYAPQCTGYQNAERGAKEMQIQTTQALNIYDSLERDGQRECQQVSD